MKIIKSIDEMMTLRNQWEAAQKNVGFVPTMGALHAGHVSLIEAAQKNCTRVVVSLFVNPTQFNNSQDLDNYPQPLEQDLRILNEQNVDAVFLPQKEEIYHDDYRFELRDKTSENILCGAGRPGHFAGVLTIVLKLLNITTPHHAFFGEKDYQQLRLIQDMTKALFLKVKIVPCPTVRDVDGLAMSSRNLRLTPEQRALAPLIKKSLSSANGTEGVREALTKNGFTVEYVEEHWGRRFVAAQLGDVRLIDNVKI